jgi:hypothetical protein
MGVLVRLHPLKQSRTNASHRVGFTAFIISEALTVYLDKAIDEKQRQKEAVDRGIPGGQEPPIRMEAMAARGAGGV